MKSAWRLLGLAAALNISLGLGTAAAQRVMVRNAPAGTPVEVILNAETVGTGTIGESGEVTIPFALPLKDGKAEMDANIFVDVCGKMRRVVIVGVGRAPAPVAEGCDRKDVSGLYWVRSVNTIVVDLAAANPALLLINGNYTPPKPPSPEEEAGESKPHAPLPKGLVLFADGGLSSLNNFQSVQCGSATPCNETTGRAYGFGATYWITHYFGVEGSYLNPGKDKVSGGTGYAFDTEFTADIWSAVGKAGVQAGPVRVYGQGGMNYHQSTVTTNETIALASQKFEIQTRGWHWVAGGGAEVWFKKKYAVFGELDVARIKGDATDGGEVKIDDRARAILLGIRVHVGG